MVGESRPPPRTPLSEQFRTLGENSFGETETSHPKKVPTLYRQDLLKNVSPETNHEKDPNRFPPSSCHCLLRWDVSF